MLISQLSRLCLSSVSRVKAQYSFSAHPLEQLFPFLKTHPLRNPLQFLITENLDLSVLIHKSFNYILLHIISALFNMVSHVRDFLTFASKSSDVFSHSHDLSINEIDEYTHLFIFSKSFFAKKLKIILSRLKKLRII